MIKGKGIYWIFVLTILSVGIASASFNLTNASVVKEYLPGDTIAGKINISFLNEPVAAILSSNFQGNSNLLGFLTNNSLQEGRDFNCTTIRCEQDYSVGQQISDPLDITQGESKLVGFNIKIPEKISGISLINFTIKTGVTPSCFRQVWVNVLDKNELYLQSTKYGSPCSISYRGCFDNTLNPEEYENFVILKNSNGYCEKITLPASPAYTLGARINKTAGVESEIKATLLDADSLNSLGNCILSNSTTEFGEVSCVVNYGSFDTHSYYVCIGDENQRGYTIRTERKGNSCGFSKDKIDINSTRDYDIFAKSMEFVGFEANINSSLKEYINTYLVDKYDGDCSKGCILPFRILAGQNQTITITNPKLSYSLESGGTPGAMTSMYMIGDSSPKLTSRMTELDLSKAGFVIPFNSSDNTFKLYLNGQIIGSAIPLNISRSFYFDVSPKFSLIGTDGVFRIISNETIASAVWKFGDGTQSSVNGNNITHRFTQSNSYTVDVEATTSSGRTSRRVVEILVGNPKESASYLLNKYDKRIINVSSQIGKYPNWISSEIEKKLKIADLNQTLTRLKDNFATSKTDEEYTKLVNDLLALKIPYAVAAGSSSTYPMMAGLTNIDTSGIVKLAGKEVVQSQNTRIRNNIVSWENEFYSPDVLMQTYTVFYEGESSDLFTTLKITGTPKQTISSEVYLMINYPIDSVKFAETYSEKAIGSYTYLNVGNVNTFELLLPGKIEINNLGVYVSTDLATLDTNYQQEITPVETKSNWLWASIWVLIILFLTLVAYILMQEWYKRRYEGYLFKNPQDLYNMINFIYNSRSSGLADIDIRNKLAGNGWKKEQVDYAFNKIDGRRTGMYEIPLFKFVENKKVRTELENRQKKPLDARFIKGNYLGTK